VLECIEHDSTCARAHRARLNICRARLNIGEASCGSASTCARVHRARLNMCSSASSATQHMLECDRARVNMCSSASSTAQHMLERIEHDSTYARPVIYMLEASNAPLRKRIEHDSTDARGQLRQRCLLPTKLSTREYFTVNTLRIVLYTEPGRSTFGTARSFAK